MIRVPFPFHKKLSMSDHSGDWYDWSPGIRWEDGYQDREAVADGVGEMLIVEVGRYTPPGFGPRVFYTRQFALPGGKLIGKPKLRVMGAGGFTRMCKGYRYGYEVVDELANVKMYDAFVPDVEDLADAASY